MTTPELEALKRRVEDLEARLAERPVRRRRWGWAVVAVASFGLAGTVLAADGTCPNTFPFCFTADTPAQAAQVNHNFSQIKEWLETKVGSVSGTTAGTGTVRTASVVSTGAIQGTVFTASGGQLRSSSGNLELQPANGSSALIFGNGNGGEAGRITAGGAMTVGGSFSAAGALNAGAAGGNVPHNCVVRTAAPSQYTASCSTNEIAVGGGGRCPSLFRLIESYPGNDSGPTAAGSAPTSWRSVCQVWGDNGAYLPPFASYAICCRR